MTVAHRSETPTAVAIGLGWFAATLVLPIGWHGLMGAMYLGIAASAPSSGNPSGVGVVGLLGAAKVVGGLFAAGTGVFAGVGCWRGLHGDHRLASRAAYWALGMSGLGVVGSVLTFDCIGALVGLVPVAFAGVTAWFALQLARELRDAES